MFNFTIFSFFQCTTKHTRDNIDLGVEPTFDKQTKWLDSIDCCRSMSFSRIQEGFVGQRSGQPVVRAG